MDHSLLIHLPTEGHLGCLQVLTAVNKEATKLEFRCLCGRKFSAHLREHHGV